MKVLGVLAWRSTRTVGADVASMTHAARLSSTDALKNLAIVQLLQDVFYLLAVLV